MGMETSELKIDIFVGTHREVDNFTLKQELRLLF